MNKTAMVVGFAAAVAMNATAATRTWIGGTGTKVWGTTSNWQNGAVPGDGDTAQFNHTSGTVTFSAAVTLPANIVFNIAKGGTVKFTGVVSGAGGVTRSGGGGDLQFTNTGNTYDGPTTVTSSTMRFASLANIGTACSLGKPTTAEKATITLTGGSYLTGNGSYTTDRPIVMGGQFWISTEATTLTMNGPVTGGINLRGLGTFKFNSYLGTAITGCTRTDKGTGHFLCPTNAFTSNVTIADGSFRGPTLANKGQPCAFGAGNSITMGQKNWSTTGTLYYNGTTDATCNRDITIYGFTNSTPTANHWGGRFCNETKGTCLTLTGSLTENRTASYSQSLAALFLGGVGDGVFTAPLPGYMAFYKEDAGTWTLTGAHTASGLMRVKAGRLNIDGSVPATCTAPTKMTVDANATLGGTGVVHGTTAVLAKGRLAAGSADRCGTLTFDGSSVSLADGVKLLFKFGAGTNDVIALGDGATFGGALEVDVSILGAATIAPGTYTLMTWGGSSAPTAVTPTTTVPDGTSFAVVGNALVMTMVDAQSLTWKGGAEAEAAWDTTSPNWLAGAAEATFAEQDFVTFDNTGSASPTVRIDETVHPSAVEVDADEVAYTFTGNGGITGHASFTKRGTNTLTVSTANSYTKPTTIEAGRYVLNGTLDGTSITVAHQASLDQRASGVIAGDNLAINLGYGTHYLRGTNTFTGTVRFDTRNHGLEFANTANVYLYLSGSNALGNASSVTIYGYSGENNHFPNMTLLDNTFISGKTFIAGNVSGQRTYIAKDSSTASVGWHGDIVGESGAGAGASLQIINWGNATTDGAIEIGTPGGTNAIRGKIGSFNFRGGGVIKCYSRFAIDGTVSTSRNDAGIAILYATNSVYTGMYIAQGTIRMGAKNVIPANAVVNIGKDADDKSHARLDLDGFDQTFTGFYETSTNRISHKCYVMTPDGKPATLTVNGTTARAWGSSHSWIQGPLTLVKAGSFNFTLNGANTYTGATLMQAGTLTLNSANALGGTTNVVLTGGTIVANASGALNANGTITVPDPANGTISLADGTAQTVEWLIVDGVPIPSGTYSKEKAGSDARLAFLARGTGSGTLLVRKGSGTLLVFR